MLRMKRRVQKCPQNLEIFDPPPPPPLWDPLAHAAGVGVQSCTEPCTCNRLTHSCSAISLLPLFITRCISFSGTCCMMHRPLRRPPCLVGAHSAALSRPPDHTHTHAHRTSALPAHTEYTTAIEEMASNSPFPPCLRVWKRTWRYNPAPWFHRDMGGRALSKYNPVTALRF